MARLSAHPYALLCTEKARTYFSGGQRRGLMVRLQTSTGFSGLAEYAPLNGIHRHGIAELQAMLEAMDPATLDDFLTLDPQLGWARLAEIFKHRWPYPLSLIISWLFFHLHLPKVGAEPQAVKLSGLVLEGIAQAEQYISRGYSCLKVKVGSENIQKEIEKIAAISSLMSPGMNLRLDANRRLSLKQAEELLEGLRPGAVQYFEEPLANPAQLPALYAHSGVDIALDESWGEESSWAEIKATQAKYLIVKPSRFSSIFWVMQRCREALAHHITPILSTCFESDWSAALYAIVAADLSLLGEAHGLAVEDFFEPELTKSRLKLEQGQIMVADAKAYVEANDHA